MKNGECVLGLFLLALAYASVGTAAAPTLTFTYSDVHANKTAVETDTYGVNNSGVIAGDYVDAKGVQHAMILKGTKLTTVDYKDCEAITGPRGIAYFGISEKGIPVGWCTSKTTGFPISFDQIPIVPCCRIRNSTGIEATGINDRKWIVGLYFDSAGVQHGFLKKGETYTTIDVKGDTDTDVYGINNAGAMTVYAVNSAGGYDSFLYNGKSFKRISDPKAGTMGTIVHTLNNKGDIDGTYYNTAGQAVGFLLHGGKYYDVIDPKADNNTRADGLNDKLEMVGRYTPSAGGNVGFKATTTQ